VTGEKVVLEGVLANETAECDCANSFISLDGRNLAYFDDLWDMEGKRVRITVELIDSPAT
jgi:hypothetical protein